MPRFLSPCAPSPVSFCTAKLPQQYGLDPRQPRDERADHGIGERQWQRQRQRGRGRDASRRGKRLSLSLGRVGKQAKRTKTDSAASCFWAGSRAKVPGGHGVRQLAPRRPVYPKGLLSLAGKRTEVSFWRMFFFSGDTSEGMRGRFVPLLPGAEISRKSRLALECLQRRSWIS